MAVGCFEYLDTIYMFVMADQLVNKFLFVVQVPKSWELPGGSSLHIFDAFDVHGLPWHTGVLNCIHGWPILLPWWISVVCWLRVFLVWSDWNLAD